MHLTSVNPMRVTRPISPKATVRFGELSGLEGETFRDQITQLGRQMTEAKTNLDNGINRSIEIAETSIFSNTNGAVALGQATVSHINDLTTLHHSVGNLLESVKVRDKGVSSSLQYFLKDFHHDLSSADWTKALEEAFQQFQTTPHILQRFENTKVEPYSYFNPETGEVVLGEGRTRLCPYYFVQQDQPKLAGILATTCSKEKKVIHGMRDGVMRPACMKK